MIYPKSQEIVVPVYLLGETGVVGTIFPWYVTENAVTNSVLRAYEIRFATSVAGIPAGDVSDSRLEKVYINPKMITKFGKPKLVDLPADIKSLVAEAYAIEDNKDATDEDIEKLEKDKELLNEYFSASRAYSF